MKEIAYTIALICLFISCKRESYSQLKIDLIPFADGFSNPVDINHAGDSRLFVVEQEGMIWIVDSTGNVLTTPFLNIKSRVNSSASEQGLLGLAFHPNYMNNGEFYVNYTGPGDSTHISRFNVSVSDPNVADATSEKHILSIAQPYRNHNGGGLVFGPDGMLYIGMGDGGSGGDPQNNAQNSMSMLGKMLRIDIDNGNPYGIPANNPFVGLSNALDEIWALGLRNPWRFSFDKKTGDLWIGDVGQNSWEEVNFEPNGSLGGENYGWRCYEALDPFNPSGCSASSNYVFPVSQYSNTGFMGDCSITGGFVYRGQEFANMQGHFFYADYCSDKLWSVRDSVGTWIVDFHGTFSGNNISTFGENNKGEIFAAGLKSGKIFKLVDTTKIVNGIHRKKNLYGSRVYPNPFKERITIDYQNSGNAIATISNIQGKSMIRQKMNTGRNSIMLSFLKSGLYILSIESDEGIFKYRIIKK